MKVLKSPCLNCEREDRHICSRTCEKLRKYRQEQYFEKPIFSELKEDLIAPRSLTRSWLMMWEAVWGSPTLTHCPRSEEEGVNYRF